jgi:hypothetical protein
MLAAKLESILSFPFSRTACNLSNTIDSFLMGKSLIPMIEREFNQQYGILYFCFSQLTLFIFAFSN